MSLSITDLKKGTVFALEGVPYRVVEYSQKVMGRGGSIVNVKIKSLIDGKVLDKTFKGGDKLDSADMSSRKAQFLYSDQADYHFMDNSTYEQFGLPVAGSPELKNFIVEGQELTVQFFGEQPIGVDLPKNVDLKVVQAEDAVKGDTATAVTKNAVVETGLSVKVPGFIKVGDILSIDTSTKAYRERKK